MRTNSGNAGRAGLETFLEESDSVHATIHSNGSAYRYKKHANDRAPETEKEDFATLETRGDADFCSYKQCAI